MTDTFIDEAVASGEARIYAHAAERFLDDAAQIAGRPAQAGDPAVLAQIGVGYALLAIRSQLAAAGGELADMATAADDGQEHDGDGGQEHDGDGGQEHDGDGGQEHEDGEGQGAARVVQGPWSAARPGSGVRS